MWRALVPRYDAVYKGEDPVKRKKLRDDEYASSIEKMNRSRGLIELEEGSEAFLAIFEKAREAFFNIRVMRGANEEDRNSVDWRLIHAEIDALANCHERMRTQARDHLKALLA